MLPSCILSVKACKQLLLPQQMLQFHNNSMYSYFLHLNSGQTEVFVFGPDGFSKEVSHYISPLLQKDHILLTAQILRLYNCSVSDHLIRVSEMFFALILKPEATALLIQLT